MWMLAALLATGLTCATPKAEIASLLVGRWESAAVSVGGLGEVLEFRGDGSYVAAVAVVVRLRYSVRDGQLKIWDPDAPAGSEQPPSMPLRFEGDEMVLSYEGAEVGRKTRTDRIPVRQPTIVGTWRGRHATGGTVYERYTEDGTLFIRLPMSTEKGCYAGDAAEKSLRLSRAGHEVEMRSFKRDGARLFLTRTGEAAVAYGASPGGAWYDIDKLDWIDTETPAAGAPLPPRLPVR